MVQPLGQINLFAEQTKIIKALLFFSMSYTSAMLLPTTVNPRR